jgi:hypothetical protein
MSNEGINLASDNNAVRGNYIGTDITGMQALSNGYGILVNGNNNVVGGSEPGEGNVISGNAAAEIQLLGSEHIVKGNLLGTDITGSSTFVVDEQNGFGAFSGLEVYGADHLIGGSSPEDRNVIAGHAIGIYMGSSEGGHLIQGNYIGTDAAGAAALPNWQGIALNDSPGTVIGGFAGEGNLISGNSLDGIFLNYASASQVIGNLIGTRADGVSPLGNGRHGIGTLNSVVGVKIGDGATPNVIAFNGEAGVNLSVSSTGNPIRGNFIHSNGLLGIDLNEATGPGVTANDAGDGDVGANNLQNYPILTMASSNAWMTSTQGVLHSNPNISFEIDLFASPNCDASTFGEGQTYLGSIAGVVTDGGGSANFAASGLPQVPVGHFVTATATRSSPPLDTSEFSECIAVVCADTDDDGDCDTEGNCPSISNPDQANQDGDEYGDVCEQSNCVTIVNHWLVPPGDTDCDGYPDTGNTGPQYQFRHGEDYIGTDPTLKCMATPGINDETTTDAWPPDFNDNQLSNGADWLHYNMALGHPTSDPPVVIGMTSIPLTRFDLNGSGIVTGADVLQMSPFFGKFCVP